MTQEPATTGLTRWCDDLVRALRLRDVEGAAIGDAVRVVEEHCCETGGSPEEEFGSPAAYAETLTASMPHNAFVSPASAVRTAAIAAGSTSGALALIQGAAGLATSGPAQLHVADLCVVLLTGLVGAGLVAVVGRSMTRLWPLMLLVVGTLAGAVVLGSVLSGPLLEIDAVAALVIGIAILGTVAAVLWHMLSSSPDHVVDPVTGRDRYAGPRRSSRSR